MSDDFNYLACDFYVDYSFVNAWTQMDETEINTLEETFHDTPPSPSRQFHDVREWDQPRGKPIVFSDDGKLLQEIEALREHLVAVEDAYGMKIVSCRAITFSEVTSDPLWACQQRLLLEQKVVAVYNFLRIHNGYLAISIREYVRYKMDYLARLPLRPELSLHLFARLVWNTQNIPVRLDETLLALSMKLVQQQVPIHKFPAAMLQLVPRPNKINRRYLIPANYGELWEIYPRRSQQFLFELERIIAIELVTRAAAERLPQELVDEISMYANPLKLPLFRDMKGIWVPWPRLSRPSSIPHDSLAPLQKPGELDCNVRWSARARKFEPARMDLET